MRNFDDFVLSTKLVKSDNNYIIKIKVYNRTDSRCGFRWAEHEVAFVSGAYSDGVLFIYDLDTVPRYQRHGLSLLRFIEILKISEENKFNLKKIKAIDVVGWPPIPEKKAIVEAMYESFGFERIDNSDNWEVEPDVLKRKIDEKMNEKTPEISPNLT